MITDSQIAANTHAIRFNLKLEKFVQDNFYRDFTCGIKLDWDYKRRSSRGGIYKNGPGINIAMASAALIDKPKDNVYRFYEYKSYDTSKVIGGFYATDYLLKLHAVIAHEVAHAVQFFEYDKLNTRCKPHGIIFKKYYSIFRESFINEHIPNQAELEKEYKANILTLLLTGAY